MGLGTFCPLVERVVPRFERIMWYRVERGPKRLTDHRELMTSWKSWGPIPRTCLWPGGRLLFGLGQGSLYGLLGMHRLSTCELPAVRWREGLGAILGYIGADGYFWAFRGSAVDDHKSGVCFEPAVG